MTYSRISVNLLSSGVSFNFLRFEKLVLYNELLEMEMFFTAEPINNETLNIWLSTLTSSSPSTFYWHTNICPLHHTDNCIGSPASWFFLLFIGDALKLLINIQLMIHTVFCAAQHTFSISIQQSLCIPSFLSTPSIYIMLCPLLIAVIVSWWFCLRSWWQEHNSLRCTWASVLLWGTIRSLLSINYMNSF